MDRPVFRSRRKSQRGDMSALHTALGFELGLERQRKHGAGRILHIERRIWRRRRLDGQSEGHVWRDWSAKAEEQKKSEKAGSRSALLHSQVRSAVRRQRAKDVSAVSDFSAFGADKHTRKHSSSTFAKLGDRGQLRATHRSAMIVSRLSRLYWY